jgi:hypothetical protein
LNEGNESYEWLFGIFLNAMEGKSRRLIITDEAMSIRPGIKTMFPDTVHRFCM